MDNSTYLTMPLIWHASGKKNVAYESVAPQGDKLLLHINEFSEEPMYALFRIEGGTEHFICDVDSIPPGWDLEPRGY